MARALTNSTAHVSLRVKRVQQRRIRGVTEGLLEEMVFGLSTDGRKKGRRLGNGGWGRTERRAAQRLTDPETSWPRPQRREERGRWREAAGEARAVCYGDDSSLAPRSSRKLAERVMW